MADIDLKTETPDTTLPATGFLFGADSQASASPSVYSVPVAAAALLSNAPNGSAAAPSFAMGTTGLYTRAVTARLNFTINGFDTGVEIGPTVLALQNNTSLSWTSGTLPSTSLDLFLTRRGVANLRLGAADTVSSSTVTITIATPGVVTWNSHGLSTGTPVFFTTTGALPTGITASTTYYVIAVDTNTFRIATSVANAIAGTAINTSGSQSGTQTGTRGAISQTLSVQSAAGTTNFPGADLLITGSQGTGTGAGGSLIFQVAPAGSSGTAQNALVAAWQISGAGHFIAGTDNLYDIGASGATRPRNVYAGSVITNIVRLQYINSADNAISFFNFYDNTGLASFALGATNPRINWGGTTSSFPALKRSTTFLQARLADDSAFAGFASANMQAATAYTVATLPGTPGTGMIARVTDATAPTIGTTVVGGGAAYALVNYNGANWTVIGV